VIDFALILAGAPLVIFAAFHLMNRDGMEGYIGTVLPFPKWTNRLAAAWLFVAGIGTATDAHVSIKGDTYHYGPLMAVAFLLAVTVLFHRPKGTEDQANIQAVLKHMAMAGGYLFIAVA
jgi:peptidoglycan/LPS O-acetylase OafA/YrhL